MSSEAVKEGLIGPSSFAGCLTKFIRKQNVLSKVTCIPSTERPAPHNRGDDCDPINFTDDVDQVIIPEVTLF